MGFPTYVGAGESGKQQSAGPLKPTYPVGGAAGSRYLLHVTGKNTAAFLSATISASPTWSLVNCVTYASTRLWCFERAWTGVETGTFTVVFTGGGVYTNVAMCHLIMSVTSTNAIALGEHTSGGTGTNRNDAAVTTSENECLAMNFVYNNATVDCGPFVGASGGTWVDGASLSAIEVGDFRTGVIYASMTAAGIIDGGILTQTAGLWNILGIAIKGTNAGLPAQTVSPVGLASTAGFGEVPIISPLGLNPYDDDYCSPPLPPFSYRAPYADTYVRL